MNARSLIILVVAALVSAACDAPPAPRTGVLTETALFDDPASHPAPSALPERLAGFDDTQWRQLDFALKPFELLGDLTTRYGWYRGELNWDGHGETRLIVQVRQQGVLFINDRLVCRLSAGHHSIDLTPHLVTDRSNLVALLIDRGPRPDAAEAQQWLTAGGIAEASMTGAHGSVFPPIRWRTRLTAF